MREIATHNRGSKQIDGIFMSHSLQATVTGLLAFGELHTDHRMLWVDLPSHKMFGFKPPEIFHSAARQLQCGNPSVQKQWIQLYTQKLQEHNLIQCQFRLIKIASSPLTSHQAKEYESILTIRDKCTRYADKKCRKLRTDNVEFSPEVTKSRLTIELWRGVGTRKKVENTALRKFLD